VIVSALYAGQPAPLGPRKALSAICKQPVDKLTVHVDRTDEDQQANLRLHGGPEKVLHQFSVASYDTIKAQYPELADKLLPGSIGENISVDGMTDENVFIGDVYAFGNVIVEVGAPRAPCNKINHRFETPNLDRFTGNQGVTGWYYRVKQTGVINVGDAVSLLERADNTVSVGELMRTVYNPEYFSHAAKLVDIPVLDDEWRGKCEKAAAKAAQ